MNKQRQFKPVQTNINFPEVEKRILREWYEKGLIAKYLHRNDNSKKRFSFLDGPITANNPMGVHHAWGRTYKDLWQRFYNLRGFKQRFQNGFDCQGLWVEVEVEKELGIRNKKDIENLVPGNKKASIAKFVELCKDRVRKYSTMQTEQSKRLGYIVDWDNSYYTMSEENNYMIWHFLKVCHEKGWIYKGRDCVPWCPRCQTAISQHEMLTEDYKEVTHKSIYVEFSLVDRNETLIVWTTTPWTIPSNIAVAVDEKIDYCLVKSSTTDNYFWVAKERLKAVFGDSKLEVVKTVKGKELVGLKYRGPFDNLPAVQAIANHPKFHTVVATDQLIMPITTTEGTGLVHTSVSTGAEDFRLGEKLGLPLIPTIDDEANYLEGFGFLSGQNAKKHPEIIIDFLSKDERKPGDNWVFDTLNYTHRYPACWRCKTELVWKVADEWYIAMDRPKKSGKKTLRQLMIETAKQITWKPGFGLERELDWLSNMHDWLISKPNRYWGLALPIWECQKCSWFTVIASREELKKKATSGWSEFEGHTPHKPFIDEVKIRCEQCGSEAVRLPDVGNVWLDAGIVGFSTLKYTSDKKYWRQWYPADFITESFPGQFKNWFYSMIAMSTVLEKQTCFKTVLGYASMLGEDGRPMHKSWGNSIEFNEGADKIGVDVMRWMFAKHNPEQNLLFGYKIADETRRKFHLLLWNVYNFFVTYANIDKWDKQGKSKNILDLWIISKLNRLIQTVTKSLENFDAATAANSLEEFVTDLSQWYVRRSRSRIGPSADKGEDKTSCYATLYEVLVTLCKLLAPFTPFIAEEMYRNLTGDESVHLADWPSAQKSLIAEEIESEMELARQIVEKAHAERKKQNIPLRQPLNSLTTPSPSPISAAIQQILKDELNILKISLTKGQEINPVYDPQITPELKQMGIARDLIRKIQQLRKEKGCKIDELVTVSLPGDAKTMPESLLALIKKETLADKITWSETLNISTG